MRKLIIAGLVLITACSAPAEKKGSEPDNALYAKALAQGNSISSLAQQALGSNLMKQVNQNGPVQAVAFCNVAATSILDSLPLELDVTIKRAAIKARNENDLPTPREREVIETYQKAVQQNIKVGPLIREIGNNKILYAAPIKTKSTMCLQCHGDPNNEISAATMAKINGLYPNDKATGHKVGDLRGIWSITFNKQQLTDYEAVALGNIDGKTLMEQNCYTCHGPDVPSHEVAIAPPMEGIKRSYLAHFKTEEAFKQNMRLFLQEPSIDNAIMKGPVKRFGVMPKFQWSNEEINAIVDYIYAAQLEKPAWFEAHYKKMHGEE